MFILSINTQSVPSSPSVRVSIIRCSGWGIYFVKMTMNSSGQGLEQLYHSNSSPTFAICVSFVTVWNMVECGQGSICWISMAHNGTENPKQDEAKSRGSLIRLKVPPPFCNRDSSHGTTVQWVFPSSFTNKLIPRRNGRRERGEAHQAKRRTNSLRQTKISNRDKVTSK